MKSSRRTFATIATSGLASRDTTRRQAEQQAQDEAQRRHASWAARERAKLEARFTLPFPLQADANTARLDAILAEHMEELP